MDGNSRKRKGMVKEKKEPNSVNFFPTMQHNRKRKIRVNHRFTEPATQIFPYNQLCEAIILFCELRRKGRKRKGRTDLLLMIGWDREEILKSSRKETESSSSASNCARYLSGIAIRRLTYRYGWSYIYDTKRRKSLWPTAVRGHFCAFGKFMDLELLSELRYPVLFMISIRGHTIRAADCRNKFCSPYESRENKNR